MNMEMDGDTEERPIYWLLVVTTAPVTIAGFARGEPIGPATTVAMLVGVLGLVGLARTYKDRSQLPRALARCRRGDRR